MTSEKQKELETLARIFNGRDYGEEVSDAEEKKLKDRGIVMMFGASDDLVEIRGAVYGEVSAYRGAKINFFNGELIESERDKEGCPYLKHCKGLVKTVEAFWCEDKSDEDFTWTFKTDIPHVTFRIYDGGEDYCRGILFYVDEIKERGGNV